MINEEFSVRKKKFFPQSYEKKNKSGTFKTFIIKQERKKTYSMKNVNESPLIQTATATTEPNKLL